MLRSADIKYFIEGAHLAGKFALGGFGRFDNVTGGMRIIVAAQDTANAHEILRSLQED
jgi:hypothetical protein